MTDSCSINTGSNPCQCKFSWKETNTASGSSIQIAHTAFTDVTTLSKSVVNCTTPLIWQTEIPDNTSITISVVPASGNPAEFNVGNYAFTKGQNTLSGNFSDNMGRSFVNILRYSCYEQRQRGLSLINKLSSGTVSNLGSFYYLSASQFCLRDYKGTLKGGDTTACSGIGVSDYSTQSYYYNMFIRDSESGDINPGNASFVCPQVTEALSQQSNNPGTQGKYWPLDSSFALSLGKTADFSVGIVAHTKTTNVNDPTAQNTQCDGTTSAPGTANSLISSCLGFAAKPNADGTCAPITVTPNANGTCPPNGTASVNGVCPSIPTYRLRRFVSLYPSIYDTDGNIIPEAQRTDMVYVLDRPVSNGTSTPYTMLGPKPCPFAYYDNSNVTNLGVGYYGTNRSNWTGANVDNIFFPYQDTGTGYAGTCSAVLPVTNPSLNKVSLSTLKAKRYVRPINAWSPHYEEDTGFQACAPQANPLRDPPLHFAVNTRGNVAWCAEVYPSQNDNYAKLGSPAGVKLYTSHTVKNSSGGPGCPLASSSTAITGHQAGDSATCDRTVVNPSTGISWAKFPLLAPESDVYNALNTDPSFACAMTYDGATGTKTNSADFSLGQSPSAGCCTNAKPPAGQSAHLEPNPAPTSTSVPYTSSCSVPTYN
jgi:hypothetical protein